MTEKRKYTKKSAYWSKVNSPKNTKTSGQTGVNKVGNTGTSTSRLNLGELGTTALNTIKLFTQFMRPKELKFPYNLSTYNQMTEEDPDIATALDANYMLVDKAFSTYTIDYNKKSKQSEDAANFIKWCFDNMEGQTVRQAVRSAMTYKKFGFSILEKVYMKVTDGGEFNGKYKLKRLAFRPQETLDGYEPFTFSSDGREILSCKQNITGSTSYGFSNTSLRTGIYEIPRNKFLLFGYNATDANPMGVSPLDAIYVAWKEKKLLGEYEVVGVSKDMGGMPVLEVPAEILNIANADPNSDEARSLRVLEANIANMHSGEQAYMIMPSDIQENSTVKAYNLTFKGIEGTGKQFDTSALIQQRKKEIYDRFGAGNLIMGNDNTGSFSLSDNKQTMHSRFIERDVDLISEILNVDLIPQLLSLNNIKLTDADMPKFISGDVGDPDIESNSKMLQRVIAVGGLPLTPEVFNEILEKCGFRYRVPEEVLNDSAAFIEWRDNFVGESTSRSGDSLNTASGGLNGTGDNVSSNDSSTLNTENAA